MPSPYPGLVAPTPFSYGVRGTVFASGLRQSTTNLMALIMNRPGFMAMMQNGSQSLPAMTFTQLNYNTIWLDNWGGGSTASGGQPYSTQFPGMYLLEGGSSYGVSVPNTSSLVTAINVGGVNIEGCRTNGTGAAMGVVMHAAYIASMAVGATWSVTDGPSSATSLFTGVPYGNRYCCEWLGLAPGTGTVITNPSPAALFPPGSGTILPSPIAAGATSFTLPNTTGLIPGSTLLLDIGTGFYEPVTIATVNHDTGAITLTAGTNFPHGTPYSPGLVGMPMSAVFMNQQVRDAVSFLAYPPVCHVGNNTTTAGTIASQTFPAGTLAPMPGTIIDTFSGYSAVTNLYTAPVAGVYQLIGQVPTGGGPATAAHNYTGHAGYAINGGTIQWCASASNPSSTISPVTPEFSTHIRLNKGDTVGLYGSQNSGSALPWNAFANYGQTSRMMLIWRAF